MPNPSKEKGSRGEREVVAKLRLHDIDAFRIPLSGAVKDGGFQGDVAFRLGPTEWKAEVKRRRSGFKALYKWLSEDGVDVLFCREDNNKWLAVLDLDDFITLVKDRGL